MEKVELRNLFAILGIFFLLALGFAFGWYFGQMWGYEKGLVHSGNKIVRVVDTCPETYEDDSVNYGFPVYEP
jgi:hypothetical protein